MPFRLPNNTQRTAILGRTGSGKTQAGAWILSEQGFDKYPFIVMDTKYDPTILNDIPGARDLDLKDAIPKHPGIYIVHPLPHQTEETERFLWRLWQRENAGLFVDEVYNLPNSNPHGRGAFQAILTQGRSKHIPVIALAQRPVMVTRFFLTEADHHMVFHLSHDDDRLSVKKFMHTDAERLPPYWSHWHNVSEGKVYTLRPVPGHDRLLETFEQKSRNIRRRGQWATRFISHGQLRTG